MTYNLVIGRKVSAQLFSYMLLTGCATSPIPAPPIIRTIETKIAVAVPCKITVPPVPLWELSRTSPDAGLFELVRAAMIEVKQRKIHEKLLEAAALGCSD